MTATEEIKTVKQTTGKFVQYGCGFSAPAEWINFDASPTLRIQLLPLIGNLVKSKLPVTFPSGVRYGDIIRGLPNIGPDSCDGVYCSHVLEHLSLDDFRLALKNTYRILRKDGIFRCVVPDLERCARSYVKALDNGEENASIRFVGVNTLLGIEQRPRSFAGKLRTAFGNSHHLWMWDQYSLANELKKAGFRNIRRCQFNDSLEPMFKKVESADRFEGAVAMECVK